MYNKDILAKQCVNLALSVYDAKVYGGYLRDHVLREEKFNDLDICFKDDKDMAMFIKILKCFNKKVLCINEQKLGYNKVVFKITINDSLEIDCTYGELEKCCDLSCNLVYMDNNGISPFIPKKLSSTPKHVLMKRALSDINHKQFSIIPNLNTTPKEMKKILSRANDMINNGWKMINYHKEGVNEILIGDLYDNTECSICLNDTMKDSRFISLSCKHKFHLNCLMETLEKTNEETLGCPLCRKFICGKKN